MKITILVDNPNSWFLPYGISLQSSLQKKSHDVVIVHDHENISNGDVAFFLACEKIVTDELLKLNKHNIVVHPSDLPTGKGFSPLAWQVLNGQNEIPITLFEASSEVDSGDVYIKDKIALSGYELNEEIKELQGKKTVDMCIRFIDNVETLKPLPQKGEESFFPRRTERDSELNISKSIKEQFNLLRIVDNERYPAFFVIDGHKYVFKIYKA